MTLLGPSISSTEASTRQDGRCIADCVLSESTVVALRNGRACCVLVLNSYVQRYFELQSCIFQVKLWECYVSVARTCFNMCVAVLYSTCIRLKDRWRYRVVLATNMWTGLVQ